MNFFPSGCSAPPATAPPVTKSSRPSRWWWEPGRTSTIWSVSPASSADTGKTRPSTYSAWDDVRQVLCWWSVLSVREQDPLWTRLWGEDAVCQPSQPPRSSCSNQKSHSTSSPTPTSSPTSSPTFSPTSSPISGRILHPSLVLVYLGPRIELSCLQPRLPRSRPASLPPQVWQSQPSTSHLLC